MYIEKYGINFLNKYKQILKQIKKNCCFSCLHLLHWQYSLLIKSGSTHGAFVGLHRDKLNGLKINVLRKSH